MVESGDVRSQVNRWVLYTDQGPSELIMSWIHTIILAHKLSISDLNGRENAIFFLQENERFLVIFPVCVAEDLEKLPIKKWAA